MAMVVVVSVNLTACRSRSAGCDRRSVGGEKKKRKLHSRETSLKKKKHPTILDQSLLVSGAELLEFISIPLQELALGYRRVVRCRLKPPILYHLQL